MNTNGNTPSRRDDDDIGRIMTGILAIWALSALVIVAFLIAAIWALVQVVQHFTG